MGTEYIGRLARISLVGGALGALIAGLLRQPTWAAGIAAGALWGIGNLLLIRFLIVRWIRPSAEKRRRPQTIGLIIGLLAKFPLLYGVGYLLIRSSWFRIEALVIGFIVPFASAFVDALARVARESRQSKMRQQMDAPGEAPDADRGCPS